VEGVGDRGGPDARELAVELQPAVEVGLGPHEVAAGLARLAAFGLGGVGEVPDGAVDRVEHAVGAEGAQVVGGGEAPVQRRPLRGRQPSSLQTQVADLPPRQPTRGPEVADVRHRAEHIGRRQDGGTVALDEPALVGEEQVRGQPLDLLAHVAPDRAGQREHPWHINRSTAANASTAVANPPAASATDGTSGPVGGRASWRFVVMAP
jgi:hypothetical protein